jgi:hypothetical protein
MPRVQFSQREKVLIRGASRQAIADYFRKLPAHEREVKWIRKTNRYRINCVQRYKDDSAKGAVDHARLVEYIASSMPAHVIDGWALLGRAIDSVLRRDTYGAIHFAYYAELRAAMGLLASEGIGILNRCHPVVQAVNRTRPLRKGAGTHAIVGPCLRQWATLSRAGELLDRTVQPADITISDWLEASRSGAPGKAVAQKWLKAWGLDLSAIEEDRIARNLASYRPSEFRLPPRLDVEEILEFVRELWQMFEPGPAGRFLVIERHLLRRALRAGGFRGPTEGMWKDLGLSQRQIQEWSRVLESDEEPVPFSIAEQTDKVESTHCHLQVVSRAALLLYVATSATGYVLRDAGYSRRILKFWWQRLGICRGLWPPSDILEDPKDMWADVQASLEECDSWLVSNAGGQHSLNTFRRRPSAALHDLGAWDAVAIWGLVP